MGVPCSSRPTVFFMLSPTSYYGSHGASLLIENDELIALQQGERVGILEGRSPLEYLQRLSDLKPDATVALGRFIDDLAQAN